MGFRSHVQEEKVMNKQKSLHLARWKSDGKRGESQNVHDRIERINASPKKVKEVKVEQDIIEAEMLENLNFEEGFVFGMSKWHNPNGKEIWRRCRILKYSQLTKKFLIQWEGSQQTKEV